MTLRAGALVALLGAITPVLASAQDSAPQLGAGRLTADRAVSTFELVCLDRLPRFETSPDYLAKLGFAQDPVSRIWYHPVDEMSVSLEPRDGRYICSLVFASNEAPGTLGLAFALAATAPGDVVNVDPRTGAATATTDDGAFMDFAARVGDSGDLHSAFLIAGTP